MTTSEDYKKLLEKVDQVTNQRKLDVNAEEDLVVGVMNLIGIEEHLFFTAEKTGKDVYFKLLNEVRKMRVELLKKIIKEYEGEVWCTSKHLLAASMRMMEVGTKHLKEGNEKEAKEYFDRAYNLYNLFWGLNLKMIDTKTIKAKGIVSEETIKRVGQEEKGIYQNKEIIDLSKTNLEEKSFFSKMGDLVKKAIDCCKE
jgi:hypothetical protein